MKPFIVKDDHRLPDYFEIEVVFLTGRKETIEVASIQFIEKLGIYEVWTKDNLMKMIPMNAIESLSYDKNWSKIVEIRREEIAKEEEKKNNG